jgi:cobalt-zinc-cadmium efflux system outer membrane protein
MNWKLLVSIAVMGVGAAESVFAGHPLTATTARPPVQAAQPAKSSKKPATVPSRTRTLLSSGRFDEATGPSIAGSALPPRALSTLSSRPDPAARRTQGTPNDLPTAIDPNALPPLPPPIIPAPSSSIGGQSLSMEAALYGTLTSNPDLIALRQGNVASAEAVEVARHFPTTLNPTLWVDIRPLVYERVPPTYLGNGGRIPQKLDQKDAVMYFSLRQPVELGHQTRYRYAIAKAAYDQQRWTVTQAELLALVQTYRFFQTSAYHREKLRVATELARFNDQLLQSLQRRQEANQVLAVDVALAQVENEATNQLVEAARQAYTTALTDLRNQIGTPETAGTAEPLGEFILPEYIPRIDDNALIQTALTSRPEIFAAKAAVDGARAAIALAKGDRIPTPVVGPVYERDEQGTQFFGFVYITPLPVFNNGMPLVRQREAEYRRVCITLDQIRQRTIAQVKAAVAKWNQANQLVARTDGLTDSLKTQVGVIQRLFDAGQTDLTKLFQARQRLIQLENARLDAVWAATQAQADLLTALGAPTLIHALQRSAVNPDTALPSTRP